MKSAGSGNGLSCLRVSLARSKWADLRKELVDDARIVLVARCLFLERVLRSG